MAQLPVYMGHHTRGIETVGQFAHNGRVEFFAVEGYKFVLEPIFEDRGGETYLVGFNATPYPASAEMQAEF